LKSESVSIELGKSTGSTSSISLVKDWLHGCDEKHKLCKTPPEARPFLPTRLLYVGEGIESTEARLHITSPEETSIQYFALSHCWGGTIAYVLTSETLPQMIVSVNYNHLARNFQDAVTFTRQMGFSYLWIDSLCIIQGSHDDWESEAQKMSSVYAQAFCTISACGSSRVAVFRTEILFYIFHATYFRHQGQQQD
jgi:hypothetical protein